MEHHLKKELKSFMLSQLDSESAQEISDYFINLIMKGELQKDKNLCIR